MSRAGRCGGPSAQPSELCTPWRSLAAAGLVAPTQVLGEVVHDGEALDALSVPSARDPSADKPVVLPEGLRVGSSLRVFDDSGLIDAHLP